MTIEALEIVQRHARNAEIPIREVSVHQASLIALNSIVRLLAEIAIELKQWRQHE